MTARIVALAVATLLLGCDDLPNDAEINNAAQYGDALLYFKDSRTGLCFAGRHLGMPYGIMTAVPCTPEVEKLLAKARAR